MNRKVAKSHDLFLFIMIILLFSYKNTTKIERWTREKNEIRGRSHAASMKKSSKNIQIASVKTELAILYVFAVHCNDRNTVKNLRRMWQQSQKKKVENTLKW